jgi:transketolase
MLHEALTASELLAERGIGLEVVNLPWLNRFDVEWLDSVPGDRLFVLEDHSPVGGLGDALRRAHAREVVVFGVEGWPACGTPSEALAAHRLDGVTLAERVASLLATPV